MRPSRTSIVWYVSRLRWLLPLTIILLGVGYILFEEICVQQHSPFEPDTLRTIFVIGVVAPTLTWIVLQWTLKVAIATEEAQHELAFRNRELAALNAIGEVTSQSLRLEDILDTAIEKIVESMGLQAGEIRVVERNNLVLKAEHGMSPVKQEEKIIRLGQCLCGKCAQTGRTLSLASLPPEPSFAETPCAKEGFHSILSVPMRAKDQIIGVILLASREPSPIALADQQILTAIGDRVAAAIENARLYEHARRRALHLETASLIGQRMTSLLELNPLLAEVVRVIRSKFGYYHTHIFLVDEEADEIVLQEASGPSSDPLKAQGLRLKIGQGITGWVAHTGQTLICNDVSREQRYFKTGLVPHTKAELAVPLRVGQSIIGVLDVQSDKLDAFDKEDVTVLQVLGNQIGIAIENARLFQETRRRYDAMVALHQTSLDMIAQLDATQLLEALLRRGAQLLDAQGGALFLLDATKRIIYNVANYNTWKDLRSLTMHLGEGAIGKVIQTGEPMIVNDYTTWEGKVAQLADSPQTRVISVPLKWKDQIIGGINIVGNRECRPFDKDDIWLLSQFADLAAIAVKNAELHTRIKEFNQELELKVEIRTSELAKASDEIAVKAEQLRSLLAKTIDIQEHERARIARDMHDGVLQLFSAERCELQAAKVVARTGLTQAVEKKLDRAFQVLDEMEKEIRSVIYDLHPPILDVVGLAPALEKYVQSFRQVSGIDCAMQVMGAPYRLPATVEISMFRMVEEALQNVSAHAAAQSSQIILNYEPTTFCLMVQDNGTGFDYECWGKQRDGNHLGLAGMLERMQNLGGEMQVQSGLGQGTRVTFRLPVVQEEDEHGYHSSYDCGRSSDGAPRLGESSLNLS